MSYNLFQYEGFFLYSFWMHDILIYFKLQAEASTMEKSRSVADSTVIPCLMTEFRQMLASDAICELPMGKWNFWSIYRKGSELLLIAVPATFLQTFILKKKSRESEYTCGTQQIRAVYSPSLESTLSIHLQGRVRSPCYSLREGRIHKKFGAAARI